MGERNKYEQTAMNKLKETISFLEKALADAKSLNEKQGADQDNLDYIIKKLDALDKEIKEIKQGIIG